VLDINSRNFLFTKAFSRPLLKQKSGRIVNIASVNRPELATPASAITRRARPASLA